MRPEVGTQPQFKKKKPPQTYRYDSSLSPALDWDTSPTREQGESLINEVPNATTLEEAKAAAEKLRALSKPFLNWAGKAERFPFDVPTLPLFIHEPEMVQARRNIWEIGLHSCLTYRTIHRSEELCRSD